MVQGDLNHHNIIQLHQLLKSNVCLEGLSVSVCAFVIVVVISMNDHVCIFVSPNQQAECAYVIILMAVYWCTEVLPLAITAILPALLFPLFGIMPSQDVSKTVIPML